MSQFSFLWHDYETFGVDTQRDRPAQFAGIRTDMDLNVIGEPIMVYCKPPSDYLPDPRACLVTGITPQICMEQGLPEREFARVINEQLGEPGTIGVGYNTIKFDDEVTRFMLWRNLMDPYAREWKSGCGRWDIMNVVRAAYALRPDGIVWPTNDEGKQSFRLEHLSKANGLAHEAAHDALSDVYATIALARLIKAKQPELFKYFFEMHKKDRALSEMDVALKEPFIHISGLAVDTGGVSIMMPIATHPTNKNEVIAWNLSKDPAQLLDIDADTMRFRLFTKKADQPEGFERMPISSIAANKSPVIIKNLKVLSATRAVQLGVDMGAALANVDKVRDVLAKRGDLGAVLRQVYDRPPEVRDVDEALYSGFVHNDDRRRLDELRVMAPGRLAQARTGFRDEKLEELFFRFKGRNFPEMLTPAERNRWEQYRHAKLTGASGSGRTFSALRQEVAECLSTAGEDDKPMLSRLLEYGHALESELADAVKRAAEGLAADNAAAQRIAASPEATPQAPIAPATPAATLTPTPALATRRHGFRY